MGLMHLRDDVSKSYEDLRDRAILLEAEYATGNNDKRKVANVTDHDDRIDKLCTVIRGVPRIWEGGGQEIFFSDLGICMPRSDTLRMAKPCAMLGGFGGMPPQENFLKRCNLVRFRVYFDQILSLFFSKNANFFI